MTEYIIIDSLGARHAIIKAKFQLEALEIYFGFKPTEAGLVTHFAINKDELDEFKKNIKNIK
jgi:hypothetical protein